jgi:hypothetical protein
MTVYVKFENNKLITAPNKPIAQLLQEGYEENSEEFVANYFYKEYLQGQIDELEKKQFRSLKAKVKNKNTKADDDAFDAYELQIESLRSQLAEL